MVEKIIELVKEQLDCGNQELTEATSFKDDLGADSLDLYELVMQLEETFGITIPTEDFNEVKTIGDVATYLEKKGVSL